MFALKKHFGTTSLVVIFVTLVLFVLALFAKGLTHDILLEAAVFLVSLKLIIMAYSQSQATQSLHRKIDAVMEAFRVECRPK